MAESLWQRTRKILSPAFHLAPLKHLIPAFNRKARKLATIVDGCVGGAAFDLNKLLYAANFDIVTGKHRAFVHSPCMPG